MNASGIADETVHHALPVITTVTGEKTDVTAAESTDMMTAEITGAMTGVTVAESTDMTTAETTDGMTAGTGMTTAAGKR